MTKNIKTARAKFGRTRIGGEGGETAEVKGGQSCDFFSKVTLMALSLSLKQWKALRRLKKVEF